jgi:hypothetical protein
MGDPPAATKSPASWGRLAALVALIALTGVLLGVASQARWAPAEATARPAADLVLAGDLFYRLGEFVQYQAKEHPDSVTWYAGYVLSQRGIGIWERQGLTATADPEALLRLGIVYARMGNRDMGVAMLRRALVQDPAHGTLYLGLLDLYGGEKQPPAVLQSLPALLTGGAHWLCEVVAVDAQAVAGTPRQAQEATALWQDHLDQFGLLIVLAYTLACGLVLAGGVMVVRWLGVRLLVVSPRRWRAPLQVPWGLWEATEVFTVMIFLMVGVTVGCSTLPGVREVVGRPGVLAPVALLLAYCLYTGVALLLAWRKAASGPQPWRLLGWRPVSPGGI